MGRKIYISSDMSIDERLIEVAEENQTAALLWPWILTSFDDWGRAEANPKRLKAQVVPMIPSVSTTDLEAAITLYETAGLIRVYESNGKRFMECVGWLDLQYNGRLPSTDWKQIRRQVFERDNYTCVYCGQRGGDLECDHIQPVSKGGSNHLSNLVTACRRCNRTKGNKTPKEWRR